ncbi:MAG: hypothetical protein DMG65_16200 [Candidatus Angelobacter sp. Gp1-AA117]|nr:MAG: hypothetical protein DMG65_16200 [Candidatus Angelobacter sp. Gp1-AA117]
MDIQEILKPIDDLWNRQHVAGVAHLNELAQPPFGSWHGYGWRKEANGVVVSPFVDDPENMVALVAKIKQLVPQEVTVEGLVTPRFREIGGGVPQQLPNLDTFQPGNIILRDCRSAHNGTIGAFLTAGDGSIWLLSNRHVMAGCSGSQLLGAGRIELGTDVRSVDKSNLVDASVVKINDPLQVNPHFEEVGPVQQFAPQALSKLLNETPLIGNEKPPVSKFGNITTLTNGKLVLQCAKVEIVDLNRMVKKFVDQLAIVSDGGLFAQPGDSGSLIISNEQPIGLLFAVSDHVIEIPENQSLKPPFYLANRLDNVIQELSNQEVVGLPLQLMLDKKQAMAAR